MSAKFATWLRVKPAPTTLAESSAIYQALSKQGRVSVFARLGDAGHEQVTNSHGSSSSSIFYAVFPHEPPTLQPTFEVPVYHDLPTARDEDPFNIRGLQNRKPMPAPRNFSCVMGRVHHRELKSQEGAIIRGHPYHEKFAVEKDGWLEGVLTKMNAPPGLARGCGIRTHAGAVAIPVHVPDGQDEPAQKTTTRKINMGSLMEMWREATSSKDNAVPRGSSQEPTNSRSGSVNRILLDADTPLGKL